MRRKTHDRIVALATVAVMIALEVVLHRLLSIKTPVVMFHLGFIPIAAVAVMYGPVWAGAAGGISEFLGSLLFPVGAYFPGFTVTQALTGVIFGLLIYKDGYRFWKACAAAVCETLMSLFLNTYFIYAFFNESGSAYFAVMSARLLKAGVMLPIMIAVIPLMHKLMKTAKLI